MTYLIFWILGFLSFWVGLKVFDDEVVLIVAAIVGSIFIVVGLLLAPPLLQIPIEVGLVLALFNLCMQCIKRGNAS